MNRFFESGDLGLQTPRKNLFAALMATVLFSPLLTAPALCQDSQSRSDTSESVAKQVPEIDDDQSNQGSDRCKLCHNNPVPPAGVTTDFCLLNEAAIYLNNDKHFQAAQLLRQPRAVQMGKLLNWDVAEDRRCLSCHANWKKDEEKRPVDWETGVNCQACHGVGTDWDRPHSNSNVWRQKSPVEKEKKGQVDVRNSARRAEQCFSCHIGNASEGKFVTHEMYAAGHPPLPGIEIESFVDQMPAHWRTMAEKGPFEHRAAFLKANTPNDPGGKDLPRTKHVIVGGLVALRESLELIADQAKLNATQGPELASFDCQACHHDLRSPSWRQERSPLTVPGRPALPEWPFALVKVGLGQVAAGNQPRHQELKSQFIDLRAKLYGAIQKQPFGDPATTQEAIQEFLKWLNPLIANLEKTAFTQEAAERAQQELLSLEKSEFPDFHSARQVVWALGVINREMENAREPLQFPEIPEKESLAARRTREAANVQRLTEWREQKLKPQRQKWAAEWDDSKGSFQLPLLLPAGLGKPVERDNQEGIEELIVVSLPKSLDSISNYDARKFREMLNAMRDKLTKPIPPQ